jgi:hypothetical protein
MRPTGAALPNAFSISMYAGLSSIATEMHADCRARDSRAAEVKWSKTFRDKYRNCITDSILLLSRAMDDNFPPPITRVWEGDRRGSQSEYCRSAKWTKSLMPWGY